MKVALIGVAGQLGRDVEAEFTRNGDEVCPLPHEAISIEKIDSVSLALRAIKPDLIVNTAAMHQVEKCEAEPEKAYAINAIGTKNLATITAELGAALMHVSTDYVFDGEATRSYREEDLPRPLNVYGNSKLAGEFFARSLCRKHFVLRTSALYGASQCRGKGGLNFVQLMLKLAKERDEIRVIDSEVVSPTSTAELARQMVALSRSESYGLYHASAEGQCSWFRFAEAVFSLTKTKTNLKVAGPNEFPMKVPRPKYSVLENAGLKLEGLNVFTEWKDGLREYLWHSSEILQPA